MLLSFGLGLLLDTYQDTGGAHAAAAVTLAYARPVLLGLVFGESYRTRVIKVMQSDLDRVALLLGLCVLVHHLTYFMLIIFNFVQVLETLKLTLLTGLATFFVSFMLTIIFSKKPRL